MAARTAQKTVEASNTPKATYRYALENLPPDNIPRRRETFLVCLGSVTLGALAGCCLTALRDVISALALVLVLAVVLALVLVFVLGIALVNYHFFVSMGFKDSRFIQIKVPGSSD